MYSTAARVGLGVAKSLFSPVGLCIISILFIILCGFNPLFLCFDLIIKSMNILSGNALIQMIIDGAFDPASPVFVIYIAVLVSSFVIGLFKFFKGSLSDIAISKDFKDTSAKNSATFSGSKVKWVFIWLALWLLLPFAFGIIMFLINLFAQLFSLSPLSTNSLFQFTYEQWSNSLINIKNIISDQSKNINNILNTFFPTNIENIKTLPQFLLNSEVKLEEWKKFLTDLSINEYAIKFKEILDTANTKLTNLLELQIFKFTGNSAGEILNYTKDQTILMIKEFGDNVNSLSSFLNDNKIVCNNLAVAFQTISEKLKFNENTIKLFFNQADQIRNFYNAITVRIVDKYNNSQLPSIVQFGIVGQRVNDGIGSYQPEKITIMIASSLYQKPVGSFMMGFVESDVINIPIIGTIINLISSVNTILTNPLELFSLAVATFGFAFCFTSFFSLLLMFGARTFDYLSMLCTAPFACMSGINDAGEKFGVWWKTFFGKALIVFIVSMSVAIFGIVIDLAGKLVQDPNILTQVNLGSNIFEKILLQFLMLVFVIGGTNGMLEFIGWCSQMLNFDNKVGKYKNSWTSKKFALTSNIQNSLMYANGNNGSKPKQSKSKK